MKRIGTFVALVAIMSLAACGVKPTLKAKRPGGNPQSTPKVDPAKTGLKRTLIANVVLSEKVEEGLQNDGLYTPDNCVQLVKWEENGTTKEMLEFTPWVNCLGGELAPKEEAANGFAIDFKRVNAGQFQALDNSAGKVYGDIQFLMSGTAGFAYTLQNICQYGEITPYAGHCWLHIYESKYYGIENF